jgi:DNA replication factor Cdt1 C-terminal domain
MPQALKDFCEIHRCFIKAFAFNRTYYGLTAPAEINELLRTTTRIYKKRLLVKEDIQRMLAIYEIPKKLDVPKAKLDAQASPFNLIASGVGTSRREYVDYVENQNTGEISWDEELFEANYEAVIQKVYIFNRRAPENFIFGPAADYPLLSFKVGSQTAARHEKATLLRTYITEKPRQRALSPELSNLSIHDPNTPPRPVSKVKARMSSLFERIKTKESANVAKPAPSSEEALRRHAIARIDEIVEVLKMKQQTKLTTLLLPSVQSAGTPLRRVSFTMTELVKMVKSSILSQMGESEIKMAITILSTETPGIWLRRLDMDGVICVVLQGNGPVGLEIQKMLQQKAGIIDNDVYKTDSSLDDVECPTKAVSPCSIVGY